MATDNTTVGIIGGLGILVVIWDLIYTILLIKQSKRWKEHHTLITLTRSSRSGFVFRDFMHNLTYGGLVPLTDAEGMNELKEVPVDMGPWDSESELSNDQIVNAERRKQIHKEKSEKIRSRIKRGQVKDAIQRQTEIETALHRAGLEDSLRQTNRE